jgi:hypothetical protein
VTEHSSELVRWNIRFTFFAICAALGIIFAGTVWVRPRPIAIIAAVLGVPALVVLSRAVLRYRFNPYERGWKAVRSGMLGMGLLLASFALWLALIAAAVLL